MPTGVADGLCRRFVVAGQHDGAQSAAVERGDRTPRLRSSFIGKAQAACQPAADQNEGERSAGAELLRQRSDILDACAKARRQPLIADRDGFPLDGAHKSLAGERPHTLRRL